MPLAEANQQSQPDHPSWMPLTEANHQHNLVIRLGSYKLKLIINTTRSSVSDAISES
jgi:hypothetical protein